MDSPLHPDGVNFDRPACNLPERDLSLSLTPDLIAQLMGEQSRLRIILIGYPDDVNQEILNLYHCGYEIAAWSPPQRIPGSAEVITVYTKRSRRI